MNDPVIPDTLEELEEKVVPKKRTYRRAPKPADMPEPEVKEEPKRRLTAADVPGVGGMVEKRWAGRRMWECPKCGATTFNEGESKVHKCKQVKYAEEEGLAD